MSLDWLRLFTFTFALRDLSVSLKKMEPKMEREVTCMVLERNRPHNDGRRERGHIKDKERTCVWERERETWAGMTINCIYLWNFSWRFMSTVRAYHQDGPRRDCVSLNVLLYILLPSSFTRCSSFFLSAALTIFFGPLGEEWQQVSWIVLVCLSD